MTSYSAATYSTVGTCPECAAPLSDGPRQAESWEPDVALRLPSRPGSVVEARRAVRSLGLQDPLGESVALIVTELVTNSVKYAGPAAHDPEALDEYIDVQLTRVDHEIRVAVHDRGPGFEPSELPRSPINGGGLGFVMVGALSKAWGVIANGHGCIVWCTLAVPVDA